MRADTVVLEPVASGWLAHDAAGAIHFLAGPAASASADELAIFVRETAAAALPEACRLVLITSAGSGQVQTFIVGARLCLLASRTLSLAQLAPAPWNRFLVLDLLESPCAALVTRAGGAIREDVLASTDPSRIAELLRMMGVRHVWVRGETASLATLQQELSVRIGDGLDVQSTADPRGHLAGALLLAPSFEPETGVWQAAPGALRIAAKRDAAYTLYRPERHVFSLEEDTLAHVAAGRPVFFVLDHEIELRYGAAVRRYSRERLQGAGQVICHGREADKTLRGVEQICRAAHEAGLRRDGIIVAAGGGVTQDLAGFAAAIYRRGVAFVRIPTTLIGLVDVAIGVKQGANAFGAKNLLGAFHPPLASILDYSFLQTLPSPALSAGFAEILKMAVICDEALLDDVESAGPALIASRFCAPRAVGKRIAERAELLMAEQLAGNLFEDNLARAVDFGHTFSPVVETVSHYRISHGEAVAVDMLLSTSIAVERGLCDSALFFRLSRILVALSLPLWPQGMPTIAQLRGALASARRHRGGALNLVVPIRAGAVTYLQDVSAHELERAVCSLQLAAASPFSFAQYGSLSPAGGEGHARPGL